LIGCFGLTEPDSGSDPSSPPPAPAPCPVAGRFPAARLDFQRPIADIHRLGQGRRQRLARLHPRQRHGRPVGPGHPRQGRPARAITGEIVMDEVFVPTENQLPGVLA
jgi:glutaryl-CoA dehydrogenase